MAPHAYITGATGCIGQNLVESLVARNWRVSVLARPQSAVGRLAKYPVRFVTYDSGNPVISEPADYIFHAGANLSHHAHDIPQQWEDNVVATAKLADACKGKVRRFVFVSTGAVADWYEGIPSGYINSKKHAEDVVQTVCDDYVIVRPPVVVGRYDRNNYTQILRMIRQNRVVVCLPGVMNFLDARDAADGIWLCGTAGQRQGVYFLNGNTHTWKEFYQASKAVMGSRCRILDLPMFVHRILARCGGPITPELLLLLDGDADQFASGEMGESADELGFTRRTLLASIEDCCEWAVTEDVL